MIYDEIGLLYLASVGVILVGFIIQGTIDYFFK
jgi:ABC-type multidrug transport system fused ATPase/permease subunit